MKRLGPTAVLLALLLSSACSLVSPEARVREKLLAAGVKPAMADCLAHKLVRKLSTSELEELDHVAKFAKRPGEDGHVGIGALAGRLQAVNDPHIVAVVSRAGLSCAILG